MCLTVEAFALFLNMLAPEMINSEPGRIVIEAEIRDVHWVAVEDSWCTMAPQIDRMDRFALAASR